MDSKCEVCERNVRKERRREERRGRREDTGRDARVRCVVLFAQRLVSVFETNTSRRRDAEPRGRRVARKRRRRERRALASSRPRREKKSDDDDASLERSGLFDESGLFDRRERRCSLSVSGRAAKSERGDGREAGRADANRRRSRVAFFIASFKAGARRVERRRVNKQRERRSTYEIPSKVVTT